MIIQVGIEENKVILRDSSGRQIALSGNMSFDNFKVAINQLDFAYKLEDWALRYFDYLRGSYQDYLFP